MIIIYLCPIFFASLLFAHFIDNDKNLYKAYGSNLLGAMVGGVCEYLSLLYGFSFLSIMAASFYFLALSFVLLKKYKWKKERASSTVLWAKLSDVVAICRRLAESES